MANDVLQKEVSFEMASGVAWPAMAGQTDFFGTTT